MSAVPKLLLVCATIAVLSVPAFAVDNESCTLPAVNKQGFRPGATVTYSLGTSPDGKPFPEHQIKCVQRAFDAWSRANSATELNVRFVLGTGGIIVRRDRPGGLALRPKAGGGWTLPIRSEDGYLERATIWLSSNPIIVDSCDGITKVILHEVGHLHGLADNGNRSSLSTSVMNRANGRNDKGESVPMAPSACDARQALNASLPAAVAASEP
jgi:hypothetical protein